MSRKRPWKGREEAKCRGSANVQGTGKGSGASKEGRGGQKGSMNARKVGIRKAKEGDIYQGGKGHITWRCQDRH